MMKEAYQKNKKEIDIVSVGWVSNTNPTNTICRCVYKTGNCPMMSMHGKVADFQIWDEALTDEQLLKVNG